MNTYDECFFDICVLKSDLMMLKQTFDTEIESVSMFISNIFDSNMDDVMEFYDFLDLLLILRTLKHPIDKHKVRSLIKTARKDPIERPWTFDDDGICSMPLSYSAAHDLFKYIDKDDNGVVTKNELYNFI